MTDQRGLKSGSSKPDAGGEDAAAGGTDEGRRAALDLLKKAAVAGPVVLTLKSTPARAATGSTSP